jgi:hypothetical protein
MAKQKYVIPVTYEMTGVITIEAESPDEAIDIALENVDMIPLPDDPAYVDGSFTVETDADLVEANTADAKKRGKYPNIFVPS